MSSDYTYIVEDPAEMIEIPKVEDKLQHYKRLSPEPIAVINGWNLNFNVGNVLKYIARYRHKGDAIGDLEKAVQYLYYEIDRLRNGGTI